MVQQDYRFLKAIVLAMGVVLMVGFAVIVATLLKRSSVKPASAANTLTLPEGGHVVETAVGPNSIVLRVQSDAGESLLILDARTGAQTGRVALVSGDASHD